MVTASVLNLINWNDLGNDLLTEGMVENFKNCKTFEEGLGPEPLCETNWGYSYFSIATLILMRE